MSYRISGVAVLWVLLLAAGVQAQTYSAIGSTGSVVVGNVFYNAQGNAAFHDGNASEVRLIYNVTNPRDLSNPAWTTLEMLAVDGGPFSTTTASLRRVPRATGSPETTLCSVTTTVDSTSPAVYSCTFASGLIDFANYYYYIRVSLGRQSTSETPGIFGVRVF